MIIIKMPVPPSLNNCYVNVKPRGQLRRARVKSPKYRAWREEAGWDVKAQKPGRIAGPYEMHIGLPVGLRGDVDNRIKPISDLLVELGIVEDDRHCVNLSIARARTTGPVIVTLRVA
jgi:Holliday junction resolvase RusA-like endonuclease